MTVAPTSSAACQGPGLPSPLLPTDRVCPLFSLHPEATRCPAVTRRWGITGTDSLSRYVYDPTLRVTLVVLVLVGSDDTPHGPKGGGYSSFIPSFGTSRYVALSTIGDAQGVEEPVNKAILLVWIASRKAQTMTPAEASRVVELSASIWTTLKDTTTTREAWFLALAHTNFYDAMDAVGSLARERKTVHVSDVVKRAERVRLSLVRSLPPVPNPPVELADDPQAETYWLRVARERQLSQARMQRQSVLA